ncbi:GyrI-like domain-containing protein [Pelosinus sp. UFO1]|uniref:GyrI-like domain-containing protein n=1 Tax=Pelosinus sp. UFO1 TaxID=484770 RepID=UPI0004D0C0DE|nr:GyrI-like domain-containing protein [Pelosinus sp. UFO1]AIF50736.1 transcription activator effector binding protein [Pelosinus sp. UFO1]
MGEKADYKKELKELYKASSKACSVIEVPAMRFLMIEGKGNPNESLEFQNAVEALFSVSYTLKFMIKKSASIDYGVMPLEGLWWCDDMGKFSVEDKDNWKWKLMIMQPSHITHENFLEAVEKVRREKKLNAADKISFATYDEGKAAQILHIGPFSEEGPTVQKLHTFILDNQYQMRGKHHEIYLSDTRRGKAENWKTIIRQPIM